VSLFIPLIVAVLSLIIIMKSASYALQAIVHYAKETGISDYIIGFFVVSIGTSLPELCTAFFSSIGNNGAISLGNVIGANVLDMTVIMGITAVLAGKIFVKDRLGKSRYLIMGTMALIILLGFDGKLSRYDGLILVCMYFIYTIVLLKQEKNVGKIKADVKLKYIWTDILVFGGTIAALLLAVRWFVLSTTTLAYMLNVPNFLMGVLFVALGTTTPELIVNIKSVLARHPGIGMGDLVGAASTNITLVIGIAALLNPIYFDSVRFSVSALFMLGTVIIALFMMKKGRVNWKEGLFLVSLYIAFVAVQGLMKI
jgi:cation:H+ antiporter